MLPPCETYTGDLFLKREVFAVNLRRQKRIEIIKTKRLKLDLHPSQLLELQHNINDNPIDSICAKIQISIQNGQ